MGFLGRSPDATKARIQAFGLTGVALRLPYQTDKEKALQTILEVIRNAVSMKATINADGTTGHCLSHDQGARHSQQRHTELERRRYQQAFPSIPHYWNGRGLNELWDRNHFLNISTSHYIMITFLQPPAP